MSDAAERYRQRLKLRISRASTRAEPAPIPAARPDLKPKPKPEPMPEIEVSAAWAEVPGAGLDAASQITAAEVASVIVAALGERFPGNVPSVPVLMPGDVLVVPVTFWDAASGLVTDQITVSIYRPRQSLICRVCGQAERSQRSRMRHERSEHGIMPGIWLDSED